jgi:hypothetical protein
MSRHSLAIALLVMTLPVLPSGCSPLLDLQRLGNPSLQVSVTPCASLPLGDAAAAFFTGIAPGISLTSRIGRVPIIALGLGFSGRYLPVRAETAIWALGIEVGPTAVICPSPRLMLNAHLGGGAYLGYLEPGPMDERGIPQPGLLLRASLASEYFLSPTWSLGVAAGLSYHWGGAAFLEAAPVLSWHKPAPLSPWLQVRETRFTRLFPALYRQYETSPPGTAVVTNTSRFPMRDLRFELRSDQYMRAPAVGTVTKTIMPGESFVIPLPILLSESILAVTEGVELTADCRFDYSLQKSSFQCSVPIRLTVLDRNALEWDDDRKASLFVTEKDPSVLEFAGSTAASLGEAGHPLLTTAFQRAVALFTALSVTGMSYVRDPLSPYSGRRSGELPVDFLKFPRQTLSYRAGDCDDLAVLFCALLESAGIESALITVPGHIYAAFRCDLSPGDTERLLGGGRDLIRLASGLWVPVETTRLAEGFLAAWEDGIRQWKAHEASGDALLSAVREAWKEYPPVGLAEAPVSIPSAEQSSLQWGFEKEAGLIVGKYLEPAVRSLLAEGESWQVRNKAGILCARFGLYERALEMFAMAGDRFQTLANTGNLLLLMRRPAEAAAKLEQASRIEPRHVGVLRSLARAYALAGDFERSRSLTARLENIADPDPMPREAEAAPAAGTRGAAGGGVETVQWLE